MFSNKKRQTVKAIESCLITQLDNFGFRMELTGNILHNSLNI